MMNVVLLTIFWLLCIGEGYGKAPDWKVELFQQIEESGEDLGGYLCFYLKARSTFRPGSKKADRQAQLNKFLFECMGMTMDPSMSRDIAPANKTSIVKGKGIVTTLNLDWLRKSNYSSISNGKARSSSQKKTSSYKQRLADEKLQRQQKHIIMYTHNGFGNQLYQISFGYLIAQSMGRAFHVADTMPKQFYNPRHKSRLDPNSQEGYDAGKAIAAFDRVDEEWVERICQGSNITFSDRKSDKTSHGAHELIVDVAGWKSKFIKQTPVPKCLFMIGYWLNPQWFIPFLPELKQFMRTALARLPSFRKELDPQSIVVHLRCAEPHYRMLPLVYYEHILNSTTYSDIWIASNPGCKDKKAYKYLTSLGGRPYVVDSSTKREYSVFSSYRLAFLSDLALLASAYRLILCPSTFSDWGGLLSHATEIHAPYFVKPNGGTVSRNWAPLWPLPNYIYHDPYGGYFNGRFNYETNDVTFEMNPIVVA